MSNKNNALTLFMETNYANILTQYLSAKGLKMQWTCLSSHEELLLKFNVDTSDTAFLIGNIFICMTHVHSSRLLTNTILILFVLQWNILGENWSFCNVESPLPEVRHLSLSNIFPFCSFPLICIDLSIYFYLTLSFWLFFSPCLYVCFVFFVLLLIWNPALVVLCFAF